MVLVAIGIFLTMGWPIVFRQTRPGFKGRTFQMTKFRTMKSTRDSNGVLLPDVERMTWFGSFLRKTSLDELPGLWCVLKGEMSLVGPRPLLVKYLPLYSTTQARRHEVKPGITGWAQVNGRNALSWDDKLALDVWYVDNQSFLLDLKILAKTVKTIFTARGVSHQGSVTMPEFKGSQLDG